MDNKIEVQIDLTKLPSKISLLEYPGFVKDSQNLSDNTSLIKKEDEISFSFKPLPNASDRLRISSNAQMRNLIIFKVKKDSSGLVENINFEGFSRKCHVFRELFDFSAESKQEAALLESLKAISGNFNEENLNSVAGIISESEIDWSTFSIPPFKFSHSSLPLSSRDIRSNLKISQKEELINQERSWNISFDCKIVPIKPADDCIFRAKNIPQEQIEIVSKIFEERPIVSKLFLQTKIKDKATISNLKFILPVLAYHCKNGPWHLLWIKYGLDPRKDCKYRFYQSIELRNKMFAKELRRGKSTASKNQESSQITNDTIDYRFDGEKLILNYLTYQYIDLTYRPLQEIVNHPAGIRSTISGKEGWYPDGTIKKLRDIMKQRWFELIRTMDLSSLPQHKLEEILKITAPTAVGSAIGADWNSFNRAKQVQKLKSIKTIEDDDDENEPENAESEGSDYEIFDY